MNHVEVVSYQNFRIIAELNNDDAFMPHADEATCVLCFCTCQSLQTIGSYLTFFLLYQAVVVIFQTRDIHPSSNQTHANHVTLKPPSNNVED